MKILKIKKNKRGFIILFAVTLSAILLSVALGVANIAYKEVSFSVSAKDSNNAFLSADTGAECALLHDKLTTSKFPIAGPATSIVCGSANILPTYVVASTDPGYDAQYCFNSANTGCYSFVVAGLGSTNNSCAEVTVFKDKRAGPTEPVNVVVTSTGYNVGSVSAGKCTSPNTRRVARELVVSSKVGSTPVYTPPPASVTLSCGALCTIPYNSSTTLSWTTSASITSCSASGGSGSNWTTSPTGSTKTWPTGNQTLNNLTSTQNYVINCSGTAGNASSNVTVVVSSAPTPTITTDPANAITDTTARLNGTVNPNGYTTNVWYRYGTTNPGATCNGTFGIATSPVTPMGSGSSPLPYIKNISGLTGGTTYYFCAVAQNGNGPDVYGAVRSFTTLSACTDPTGGDGTPVISGGYRYHTFTNSGTFTTNCSKAVTYLAVAGGGGGGSAVGPETQGGGGGAGGVLYSSTTLPANSYAITVGNGGGVNGNGGNSIIAGIATAIGGGRGGSGAGGSGGGTSGVNGLNSGVGGAGTAGQGYKGGDGSWGAASSRGSGGGGAGGAGQLPIDSWDGGPGGAGVQYCLPTCTWYSYGGGGGFGSYNLNPVNRGSGGGGEHNTPWPFEANPAAGIGGIVIIRYVYP